MKVHYINILLFALPLNILVSSKKNTYIKYNTLNTKLIRAHRTLCECELYALSNYDNDPQMKQVMENFNKQTQQRFHEYDESMKTTRQKCKDQCDKEIQKIILKDKLEKQMEQQLTTLETKIDTDDIPTCICEKSLAEKMEKTCLKCGSVLGGGIPGFGLVGGYGVYELVELAKVAATASAERAGMETGIQAGIAKAIAGINKKFHLSTIRGEALGSFLNKGNYFDEIVINGAVKAEYIAKCMGSNANTDSNAICLFSDRGHQWAFKAIEGNTKIIVKEAAGETAKVTAEVTPQYIAEGITEATSANSILCNPILISFIVVVTIVIILLIIYLILRYRRKKKMKKKLQYIKLLKE
ncbi:hypothetical protein PFAG_05888 [Plasmodium falciparum Santa Lucia]|uniref:Surface antigen n=1 Tax=Plasmodium falciparum Santa Lucia TaxID=478859 RepID=W7FIH5_PLAFA|nr:hypothetical protein PFAG_05888 [Plasmodium falciparum Santa Lucia]